MVSDPTLEITGTPDLSPQTLSWFLTPQKLSDQQYITVLCSKAVEQNFPEQLWLRLKKAATLYEERSYAVHAVSLMEFHEKLLQTLGEVLPHTNLPTQRMILSTFSHFFARMEELYRQPPDFSKHTLLNASRLVDSFYPQKVRHSFVSLKQSSPPDITHDLTRLIGDYTRGKHTLIRLLVDNILSQANVLSLTEATASITNLTERCETDECRIHCEEALHRLLYGGEETSSTGIHSDPTLLSVSRIQRELRGLDNDVIDASATFVLSGKTRDLARAIEGIASIDIARAVSTKKAVRYLFSIRPTLLDELRALYSEGDYRIKRNVAVAMGECDHVASSGFLIEALSRETDQDVRLWLSASLAQVAAPAHTPQIHSLLSSEKDPRVLCNLIKALGRTKDPTSVPILRPFLHRHEQYLVKEAALALAEIATDEAVSSLEERLTERFDAIVYRATLNALEKRKRL